MSKNVKRITTYCQVCGKAIITTENKINHGHGRVCSARCRGLKSVDHMNAVRPTPKKNSGSFKPGNNKGMRLVEWKSFKCHNCGKRFELPPNEIKRRNGNPKFCSVRCRGEYRTKYQSGAMSPFWVGGVTTYRGKEWESIRKIVVIIQKGKCAKCGKKIGDSLPVHHVRPYRDFINSKDANKIDNLIGLCQSCHMHTENPKGQKRAEEF